MTDAVSRLAGGIRFLWVSAESSSLHPVCGDERLGDVTRITRPSSFPPPADSLRYFGLHEREEGESYSDGPLPSLQGRAAEDGGYGRDQQRGQHQPQACGNGPSELRIAAALAIPGGSVVERWLRARSSCEKQSTAKAMVRPTASSPLLVVPRTYAKRVKAATKRPWNTTRRIRRGSSSVPALRGGCSMI